MKVVLSNKGFKRDHQCLGYETSGDRNRAIKAFIRSRRYNFFVKYRDVQSEFALQVTKSEDQFISIQ